MFLNFCLLFLQLAFIGEDEYLAGLSMIINSPNSIALITFFFLSLMMKQYLRLFYSFWTPKAQKHVERYQTIEDRLFMEEYEDPE